MAEHTEFGDQLETLIELAKRPSRERSELDQALRSSYRQTDAKYAKQRDLEFPEPRLEVQFELPFPAASIRLWSPGEAIKDRTHPSIHLQEKARSEYRSEHEETTSTRVTDGRRLQSPNERLLPLLSVCRNSVESLYGQTSSFTQR